ncbi:MAG: S-adenosylmethionine decarboxylase [Bacilli bacterium]
MTTMTHFMFDGYGVKSTVPLGDANFVNQTINLVLRSLNIKPISPAYLLPYDYGLVPLDEGLSSFIFLPGGHLTIHTFPLRGCYFVDLTTQTTITEKQFAKALQTYWPSDAKKSRLFSANRIGENPNQPFDPTSVFGPHVMATLSLKKALTLEAANQFLEGLIADIGMTPITRAYGIYDTYQNPTYLSSIVMIAESHLSIHLNLKTNQMFFDIFSCKMFDYAPVKTLLNKFGNLEYWHVVPRGEKHDPRSTKRKSKVALPKQTKVALNWWKERL